MFILNKRLNMLANPAAEMVEFQEKSLLFIEGLGYMAQSIPLYKYIPTPSSRRFLNAVQFLEDISLKFISERKAALKDLDTESVGFLDQWLANGKLSTKEIVPLMRDFLAAGVDTVGTPSALMVVYRARPLSLYCVTESNYPREVVTSSMDYTSTNAYMPKV